jgi:acyl dehydratase
MTFDYIASAELFMAKRKHGARQPLSYRRFATAAEAIRFAVEEFPTMPMHVAWMLVEDERFDSKEIQRLYESDDYPLGRRAG